VANWDRLRDSRLLWALLRFGEGDTDTPERCFKLTPDENIPSRNVPEDLLYTSDRATIRNNFPPQLRRKVLPVE
jgi:hypothetical protein